MKSVSISVIIVNYNVTTEVDECLASLLKYGKDLDLEIIVIDNNSPDRSIENLKQKYPEINFQFMKENLGYSKANNLGVQLSRFDYILLLNPDTVLIEDFITPIIRFAENNNSTGACGPMLLYKDHRYQYSNGFRIGYFYEAAEAFMFINYYRKFLKWIYRKHYSEKIPFEVNWMSGACLLMKKEIFSKVGGFNTEYFMNYEDIDLCKRIDEIGYRNYYFPGLHCIHLDQTSQKRDYERFTFSRYTSRLIYAKNNYNIFKKNVIRLIHVLGLIFRLATVKLFYKNKEMQQRKKGYYRAFLLYLGFRK